MKHLTVHFALLSILIVTPCSASSFGPSGYTFYEAADYEKALAHARQANKKVLVVLTLPNCPPCNYTRNQLSRETFREIYQHNFIGVYALWPLSDADKKVWIAYTDRRTMAPIWVFLTPTGEAICREIGAFNIPEEGIALGKKVLAMSKPPAEATNQKRLPQCSKL